MEELENFRISSFDLVRVISPSRGTTGVMALNL